MKKSMGAYVFIFLGMCHSALAGTTHLKTELGLKSEYSENIYYKNQLVGLEALFHFNSELASNLIFKTNAGFQLQTGFGQNQYVNQYQAQNGFLFYEASLNWTPRAWFWWSLGALNQKANQPFSLIQKGAFPSSHEAFRAQWGSFSLTARGHQSIPMSDDSVFPEKQGMPFLLQNGIDFAFKNERTTAELGVDHMRFFHLSRASANESRFLGNTVSLTTPDQAAFAYDFENILLHAEVSRSWLNTKLETSLRAEYGDSLKNPSQYAKLTPQIKWNIHSNLTLSFNSSLLAIESDFFPGSYLNKTTGPANSGGFQTQVQLDFPKSHFSLAGEFTSLRPINANANQDRFTFALLKVVHNYDLF